MRGLIVIATLGWISTGLCAQSLDTERWHEVAQAPQGRIYLDTRTVERNGQRVSVWLRTDLTVPGKGGETVWMDHREYDCVARTTRLLAYSELMSDGSVRTTNSNVVAQPQAVQPDSVGEAELEAVCPRSR
jgi:hypothetical protein